MEGKPAMHGADRSDLILPLLDGAFEDPPWADFLERLRETTGADYASLIFRPPAPLRLSVAHLYAGEQWSEPMQRLYRESLHHSDPVPYHQLEDGRAYALDELIDPADPVHQAYRRMNRDNGFSAAHIMRVTEPSGVNVWLTIGRRQDFAVEHRPMLTGLAPYLRTALRGFVALERARFSAAVAGEAIRRLNFGWLSLDGAGRILDADAQGEHLLAQSGIVRRGPDGRLTARPLALDREIMAAVKVLADTVQGRPHAIILGRDPWLDMLLIPAGRRTISSGPPPAVIAYIHGDDWSSADRCDQLADLFELLPSEARLALALSRGMTIAEAARDLALTVETARTYSKRIYAKTGARGQPDLMRFIHRSVLAIA
jgi:DNA-binding CsgD family transcriptional regulator